MSAQGSQATGAPPLGQDSAAAMHQHHARSFKLRFASQREPGRSYVSLVKPHSLPATVTDKFYSSASQRERAAGGPQAEAERRALARIQDMFRRGPREALPAPLTESHVYGWWSGRAGRAEVRGDARFDHRIRDSAWLKGRLLVLAADLQLRRS